MGETVHTIEPASSGRAKCRGCGKAIAKGELRLGERLPNPFADDSLMTLWFHLQCAAFKRPEVILEALDAHDDEVPDADRFRSQAAQGTEHRRLPRVDGVQRDPSGRATCRNCRERIEKNTWRIGLVFYEEGRFNPSGYIHAGCANEYLGTSEILERLRHFSPDLTDGDAAEISKALAE